MAHPPVRMEYRLALSDVERGLDVNETLIIGHDDEESGEHLTLRVLAWCILYDPTLTFGPGVNDPDGADLWAHDLTGRVTKWVECGETSADKLRHVVRHRRGARVMVISDDDAALTALAAELERGRALESVERWLVEPELVASLAASELRRRRWAVTISGGQLYVDADGTAVDGAITRR